MFSVIIPNYNGKKFLENCLSSIEKANQNSLVNEIIVVDNGSLDGSIEAVRNFQFSNPNFQIKLIKNKSNLGFARAVNQGILSSESDFVAVMNNDLKISENWFSVMAKAIKKYHRQGKIGAYFGKVLNWDGTKIESAGLTYLLRGKAFNRGAGQSAEAKNYQRQEFILGPSASAVVYYRQALMEVGPFDENFFAYEEDVDLALRLAGAGWRTLFLPEAVVYHLGGGTSRKMGNLRQRMDAKNWWFIIIKNYPLPVLVKYGPEIILERLRNLSGLIKVTPWYQLPRDLLRTYGEVAWQLPGMLRKRLPIEIEEGGMDK